ncbi:MAG: TonB-dependent receptor [Arcicella sp.]|jgi:TonB-dependent receptor|nr:TonB-dependent receptor [Arcicella sp.]
MMMQKLLSTFFILITSLSFTFAQEGTIRGTIKDAKSKEDLVGATVFIEGLNKGAAADINGFFSISRVPVGTYKLKISFVGYKVKYLEDIKVIAEQVTEINTFIEEEGATLNEVKVVGQRLTNTEVSVISEIKAAQQIVSGISAAQIGKTLDRNAAEVVKRVPGVTIFGERFINIRGLNERYNTVLLNNAFAPSMEADVRSFSFDVIPSAQIDRILVFKSPAAELPGEFAGGVVKIFTKSIPDNNYLTIDVSGGSREGTTGKEFFQPQMGKNYLLGFNNGFADLPKFFPSTAQLKQFSTSNPIALTQAGQLLRNTWTPVQSTAIPDLRMTITGAYKLIDRENLKLANVTAVNYSNTRSTFEMLRSDFGYTASQSNETTINEDTKFSDLQYNNAIRLGVLHNWALRLSDKHTFEFKNLFNQMSNAQYVNRNGFENGGTWNIRSLDQIFRGIYTGQVLGRHKLNEGKTNVDWVVAYNKSYRDQPDYKRFRYSTDNGATPTLLVPFGAAQTVNLGRTNIVLDEKALMGGINLVQKLTISKGANKDDNREVELKAGVFYENKDRTFNARNLGFVRANGSLFDIGTLPIEQIFAQQNINLTNGVKIDEQTNASDSYTASNNQIAFYASGNYSFTKKLNLIAGVRVEKNVQKLNSFDISKNAPVNYNRDITNILPSANLTYNFSEKSLLRFAYGKTINRPEFREIAPFSFYDFVNNRVIQGNSNLENAEIDNLDFRYEFYPTPSEIISIAAFYKRFKNPIEVIFDGVNNNNISFSNAQSAFSTGIELELRKSLDKLTDSKFLNKINLVFNGAFIYSRVKFNDNTINQSDNRPLQGQSPFIINAGINYNDTKKNTQVSLLFNVIGKRIYAVGNSFAAGYPDWYEMPRNVLDLTFSKEVHKNVILKGGITDILNNKNYILQDGNRDANFDSASDQIIQSFAPGRVYSLGVVYTLR